MGKDYSNLGLDDQLMSVNSLAATGTAFTSATEYDATIEQGLSSVKNNDTFVVVKSGTLGLSGASTTTDFTVGTVLHNFGKVPAVIAYSVLTFNGSSQYTQLPSIGNHTSSLTLDIGGGTTVLAGFSTDALYIVSGLTSTLFVYQGNASAAGSYAGAGIPWSTTIKYYLLRETAK